MKFLKFELYPMPTVQVKFTNAKKNKKKKKIVLRCQKSKASGTCIPTLHKLTADYDTHVVCVFKIVAYVITPGCTVQVMWDFDLHREKCRLGGLGVRVSPTTCMASPSHNKQLLIPNR